MPSSRLNTNIIWLTCGHLASVIAVLTMTKLWAIYFDPDEFGVIALVIGTASMLFATLLGPVLQTLLVGYVKYSKSNAGHDYRVITSNLIRRRLTIYAIPLLFIGEFLCWYWGLHWTIPILVLGLITVDTARTFEQRLCAAAQRQRAVAILTAGDVVFRAAFVFIFLLSFEPSVNVAIAGNLIGATLFILSVYLLSSPVSLKGTGEPSAETNRKVTDETNNLAKPLLPSLLLSNLTETGNRYIISAILGLQSAGLYFAAYGLVRRPYGILGNIGETLMTPALKIAVEHGEHERIKQTRFRWLVFIVTFSLLGALLFYVLREPLVLLLLSEEYLGAADLLSGLAIAITLHTIANVFNWFSMTLGKSQPVLTNNLVGSTVTTVLTVLLCASIGINGAIWALVFGHAAQLTTSMITFKSVLALHENQG